MNAAPMTNSPPPPRLRRGSGRGVSLLVHARPSRLFPHLLVLMLADLLAPLLYDGRHSPSLGLDTKAIISISQLRPNRQAAETQRVASSASAEGKSFTSPGTIQPNSIVACRIDSLSLTMAMRSHELGPLNASLESSQAAPGVNPSNSSSKMHSMRIFSNSCCVCSMRGTIMFR